MSKTTWSGTGFPGVRFREHDTRKHGVQKDRYFAIRAQIGGKRREEGLGWSSEGWSAKKAAVVLAELKKAHLTGEGPTTLHEKRQQAQIQRDAEAVERAKAEAEAVTLETFVTGHYLPQAKADKKPNTYRQEEILWRKWIGPVMGSFPIRSVSPFDVERVKKRLMDADRAPRTIEYSLAVIRQIFNAARRAGLWEGEPPTATVKAPKVDNARHRFLTVEEAGVLLTALRTHSVDVHDTALLSLHCGLRFNEIVKLRWSDIDLAHGLLHIRDAKAGTRQAFLTDTAAQMLRGRGPGPAGELVFQSRIGKPVAWLSATFKRVVEELGFNDGVTDRRQKIVFHSLRHSYASWLVENGTDLYVVQHLLGHKTGTMTRRYAHMSPGVMRDAVAGLSAKLNKPPVVELDKEQRG